MLDSLDLKILNALKKNARASFVVIATELSVKPGLVQARYAKMKKNGVIKATTLVLDNAKMNKRYTASIGIKALDSELSGVIEYIESLKIAEAQIICWVTFGCYNISSMVVTKNVTDIRRITQLIKEHPSVKEAYIHLTNYDQSWGITPEQILGEETSWIR
jgi:DNA-binding Lrp family transcriptional regulator